ncbi:ribose-phosphate diphosphokinase [Holzapfeliella floricola]|uniref:Putative ribose-phosphate pyrophosphokinase n=1 Tax=Holzapfeliella floricola DSM 23037 = JCM 16512 TaxID=1423744 RepID=A0A0R2DL14_9LACO|nr:ribose-phosphate pyrophosphokinase [Holzapfeliella floricola]KRN04766.1 ribose-p pyrokinase [Holzapfeliella floricola DSM 23037 = JCM 16512]
MSTSKHSIKLLGLNGNLPLAEKIAAKIGAPLLETSTRHFSDGEIQVNIDETIRGDDIYVIQSLQNPINENIMETLIVIDALRRASAHEINVVLPYFAYSRADRKTHSREPITAKLLANMIEEAGADRVITLDLHADQVQGFFDIPVDHLQAIPILAKYFISKRFEEEDIVIISPDHSGTKLARRFAEYFNAPIAIIDQRGPHYDTEAVKDVIGDVKDKTAIVVDDMIDTGVRFAYASKSLLAAGAKEIYGAATHALLSNGASQLLNDAPIEEIAVTDSIELPKEQYPEKIKRLSVDYLFANAIEHIYDKKSIHSVFEEQQKL